MENRRKKLIISMIGVVGITVLFLILHPNKPDTNQFYGQKVSELTKESLNVNRYSGIVETQKTENYPLESDKKVIETYVKKGDKVNIGDALFKYDVSQAAQSISNTNLEIEGIQQSIQILKKEVSELNQRMQEAEQEEQIQIRSEIVDKQLEIKQQEFDIQSKQNEMNTFQEEVNQSIVKANIHGIIQSVSNQKQESTGGQNSYITIIQNEQYIVKGSMDEMSMGSLKEGDSVIIRSRTDQEQIWKGKISKIEQNQEKNTEEESQESSGQKASNYPFYVELENNDQLILGQHVYVEPNIGQYEKMNGIWIDKGFVVKEAKNSYYVWIVKNDKAQKQTVKIGKKDKQNGILEIYSGLKKKDYIVWPDKSLKSGDQIQIQ